MQKREGRALSGAVRGNARSKNEPGLRNVAVKVGSGREPPKTRETAWTKARHT